MILSDYDDNMGDNDGSVCYDDVIDVGSLSSSSQFDDCVVQ